jgi:hypothetical protein
MNLESNKKAADTRTMVTNACQTMENVGLNKTVYWHVTASASSGTMKHRRGASEREPQEHYAQLRLCAGPLALREPLLVG